MEISNFIMDERDKNKFIKGVIIVFMFVNPTIIVAQSFLAHKGMFKMVVGMLGIFSVVIAIIVLYCGRIFRKSLGNYFSGSYISNVIFLKKIYEEKFKKNFFLQLFKKNFLQVRMNVFLIVACFVIRACYDFLKLGFYDWFTKMRENSHKNDTWEYAIFFFALVIIFEIVPLSMFLYNLRYIMSNRVALEPKQMVEYNGSRIR